VKKKIKYDVTPDPQKGSIEFGTVIFDTEKLVWMAAQKRMVFGCIAPVYSVIVAVEGREAFSVFMSPIQVLAMEAYQKVEVFMNGTADTLDLRKEMKTLVDELEVDAPPPPAEGDSN